MHPVEKIEDVYKKTIIESKEVFINYYILICISWIPYLKKERINWLKN